MGCDTIGGDGIDWTTIRIETDLLNDGGDSGAQVGNLNIIHKISSIQNYGYMAESYSLDRVAVLVVVAKRSSTGLSAVAIVSKSASAITSSGSSVTSCSISGIVSGSSITSGASIDVISWRNIGRLGNGSGCSIGRLGNGSGCNIDWLGNSSSGCSCVLRRRSGARR